MGLFGYLLHSIRNEIKLEIKSIALNPNLDEKLLYIFIYKC